MYEDDPRSAVANAAELARVAQAQTSVDLPGDGADVDVEAVNERLSAELEPEFELTYEDADYLALMEAEFRRLGEYGMLEDLRLVTDDNENFDHAQKDVASGLYDTGLKHLYVAPEEIIAETPRERETRPGYFATNANFGSVWHELGHHLIRVQNPEDSFDNSWGEERWEDRPNAGTISHEVSVYAMKGPMEYVAEVFSGLMAGERYSDEIMEVYDTLGGPSVPSGAGNPDTAFEAMLPAGSNPPKPQAGGVAAEVADSIETQVAAQESKGLLWDAKVLQVERPHSYRSHPVMDVHEILDRAEGHEDGEEVREFIREVYFPYLEGGRFDPFVHAAIGFFDELGEDAQRTFVSRNPELLMWMDAHKRAYQRENYPEMHAYAHEVADEDLHATDPEPFPAPTGGGAAYKRMAPADVLERMADEDGKLAGREHFAIIEGGRLDDMAGAAINFFLPLDPDERDLWSRRNPGITDWASVYGYSQDMPYAQQLFDMGNVSLPLLPGGTEPGDYPSREDLYGRVSEAHEEAQLPMRRAERMAGAVMERGDEWVRQEWMLDDPWLDELQDRWTVGLRPFPNEGSVNPTDLHFSKDDGLMMESILRFPRMDGDAVELNSDEHEDRNDRLLDVVAGTSVPDGIRVDVEKTIMAGHVGRTPHVVISEAEQVAPRDFADWFVELKKALDDEFIQQESPLDKPGYAHLKEIRADHGEDAYQHILVEKLKRDYGAQSRYERAWGALVEHWVEEGYLEDWPDDDVLFDPETDIFRDNQPNDWVVDLPDNLRNSFSLLLRDALKDAHGPPDEQPDVDLGYEYENPHVDGDVLAASFHPSKASPPPGVRALTDALEAWGATRVDAAKSGGEWSIDFEPPLPGDPPIRASVAWDRGVVYRATLRLGVLDLSHADELDTDRLKDILWAADPPENGTLGVSYGDTHYDPRPHFHLGWAPTGAMGYDEEEELVREDGQISMEEQAFVNFTKRLAEGVRDEFGGEFERPRDHPDNSGLREAFDAARDEYGAVTGEDQSVESVMDAVDDAIENGGEMSRSNLVSRELNDITGVFPVTLPDFPETEDLRETALAFARAGSVGLTAPVESIGRLEHGMTNGSKMGSYLYDSNKLRIAGWFDSDVLESWHERGDTVGDSFEWLVLHELGHGLHNRNVSDPDVLTMSVSRRPVEDEEYDGDKARRRLQAAESVSSYARTNAAEFVAEVFAGLCLGKEYSDHIMWMYRDYDGPEEWREYRDTFHPETEAMASPTDEPLTDDPDIAEPLKKEAEATAASAMRLRPAPAPGAGVAAEGRYDLQVNTERTDAEDHLVSGAPTSVVVDWLASGLVEIGAEDVEVKNSTSSDKFISFQVPSPGEEHVFAGLPSAVSVTDGRVSEVTLRFPTVSVPPFVDDPNKNEDWVERLKRAVRRAGLPKFAGEVVVDFRDAEAEKRADPHVRIGVGAMDTWKVDHVVNDAPARDTSMPPADTLRFIRQLVPLVHGEFDYEDDVEGGFELRNAEHAAVPGEEHGPPQLQGDPVLPETLENSLGRTGDRLADYWQGEVSAGVTGLWWPDERRMVVDKRAATHHNDQINLLLKQDRDVSGRIMPWAVTFNGKYDDGDYLGKSGWMDVPASAGGLFQVVERRGIDVERISTGSQAAPEMLWPVVWAAKRIGLPGDTVVNFQAQPAGGTGSADPNYFEEWRFLLEDAYRELQFDGHLPESMAEHDMDLLLPEWAQDEARVSEAQVPRDAPVGLHRLVESLEGWGAEVTDVSSVYGEWGVDFNPPLADSAIASFATVEDNGVVRSDVRLGTFPEGHFESGPWMDESEVERLKRAVRDAGAPDGSVWVDFGIEESGLPPRPHIRMGEDHSDKEGTAAFHRLSSGGEISMRPGEYVEFLRSAVSEVEDEFGVSLSETEARVQPPAEADPDTKAFIRFVQDLGHEWIDVQQMGGSDYVVDFDSSYNRGMPSSVHIEDGTVTTALLRLPVVQQDWWGEPGSIADHQNELNRLHSRVSDLAWEAGFHAADVEVTRGQSDEGPVPHVWANVDGIPVSEFQDNLFEIWESYTRSMRDAMLHGPERKDSADIFGRAAIYPAATRYGDAEEEEEAKRRPMPKLWDPIRDDVVDFYRENEGKYQAIWSKLKETRDVWARANHEERVALLKTSYILSVLSIQAPWERAQRAFSMIMEDSRYGKMWVQSGVGHTSTKMLHSMQTLSKKDVWHEVVDLLEDGYVDAAHARLLEDDVKWLGDAKAPFTLANLGFTEKMCLDANVIKLLDADTPSGLSNEEYDEVCAEIESFFPDLSDELASYELQWLIFDYQRFYLLHRNRGTPSADVREEAAQDHPVWFDYVLGDVQYLVDHMDRISEWCRENFFEYERAYAQDQHFKEGEIPSDLNVTDTGTIEGAISAAVDEELRVSDADVEWVKKRLRDVGATDVERNDVGTVATVDFDLPDARHAESEMPSSILLDRHGLAEATLRLPELQEASRATRGISNRFPDLVESLNPPGTRLVHEGFDGHEDDLQRGELRAKTRINDLWDSNFVRPHVHFDAGAMKSFDADDVLDFIERLVPAYEDEFAPYAPRDDLARAPADAPPEVKSFVRHVEGLGNGNVGVSGHDREGASTMIDFDTSFNRGSASSIGLSEDGNVRTSLIRLPVLPLDNWGQDVRGNAREVEALEDRVWDVIRKSGYVPSGSITLELRGHSDEGPVPHIWADPSPPMELGAYKPHLQRLWEAYVKEFPDALMHGPERDDMSLFGQTPPEEAMRPGEVYRGGSLEMFQNTVFDDGRVQGREFTVYKGSFSPEGSDDTQGNLPDVEKGTPVDDLPWWAPDGEPRDYLTESASLTGGFTSRLGTAVNFGSGIPMTLVLDESRVNAATVHYGYDDLNAREGLAPWVCGDACTGEIRYMDAETMEWTLQGLTTEEDGETVVKRWGPDSVNRAANYSDEDELVAFGPSADVMGALKHAVSYFPSERSIVDGLAQATGFEADSPREAAREMHDYVLDETPLEEYWIVPLDTQLLEHFHEVPRDGVSWAYDGEQFYDRDEVPPKVLGDTATEARAPAVRADVEEAAVRAAAGRGVEHGVEAIEVDQPENDTRGASESKPAPKAINDREFSIVVPKRDNSGNPIKPEVIEEFAHRIAQRFGGITLHPMVAGCFIPDEGEHEGELMCEENAIISVVRDSTDGVPKPLDEQYIRRTAEDMADQFGQYSIMTTEEKSEVEFVPGEYVSELPDDMIGKSVFRSLL